jgi:hypothetical protein
MQHYIRTKTVLHASDVVKMGIDENLKTGKVVYGKYWPRVHVFSLIGKTLR